MPSIGGAIAGVGALGGAAINSSSASKASSDQTAAQEQAAAVQQAIYSDNVANLQPFKNTGIGANYSLADLFGVQNNGTIAGNVGVGQNNVAGGALTQLMALSGLDSKGQPSATAVPSALQQFTNSTPYQFALQQGQQALDRSAASKGLVLSGAQLKDSQSFGQGLASQQLGTYTTNLQNLYSGLVSGISNLSNQGQNSAATTGQQGLTSAGQIGQSLANAGTTAASGIVGSSNAASSGISNSLAALTSSNSSYGGANSALGSLASGLGNLFGSSGTTGGTGTAGGGFDANTYS